MNTDNTDKKTNLRNRDRLLCLSVSIREICGHDFLFPKPTDWLARKIHPDTLHLRVKIERVLTHLASVTRLLITSERRRGVHHIVGIDPDHARFDRFCETMRTRDVLRPYAGRQTINRIVRFLDQLVIILESDHA